MLNSLGEIESKEHEEQACSCSITEETKQYIGKESSAEMHANYLTANQSITLVLAITMATLSSSTMRAVTQKDSEIHTALFIFNMMLIDIMSVSSAPSHLLQSFRLIT